MFFKVKGSRLFLCGCLLLSSHSFSFAKEGESDFPIRTTSVISSNSKTATSSRAHQSASEEFVREQQALEQKHADERSDILWQPHTLSDVRRNRIIANHNSLEQRLAQKMELEDYLSSLDEVNLTTGTRAALPTSPKQAPLDKGDSTLTALAHSTATVESSQLYPTATSTNSNQNNTVLEASTKAQPNPHSKAQALNSSGSNQGSVISPSQSIGKSTNPRANHSQSYSSSPSVSISISKSTNKGAIYHSSTLSSALKADRASSIESTSEDIGHGNSNAGGLGQFGPHLKPSYRMQDMAVARARAVARAVARARARAMPMTGSEPILRHLTKATEPLALSSKEEALTVSKAQLDHCLINQLIELLTWYLCMVSLPS